MSNQFNSTAVLISLGLSIAMVFAVIFGAKFYFENTAKAPIALSPIQSEDADSPECQAVVAAAPAELMGQPRAEIAEPVPPGAVAWAKLSSESVSLRCGASLPYQYTTYSQTQDVDGDQWLQVKDMTPGSNLTTWYNTERTPVVAVTTFNDERPAGLVEALAKLPKAKHEPRQAPLSQLKTGPADMCNALEKALPAEAADEYTRRTDIKEKNTYVWSAKGREDIVVRCGVAPPENYAAGAQLQQVNNVPWFEDTTLAEGTTGSTRFALGRSNDLALFAPQDAANSALVRLSDALVKATPSQ